MEYGKIEARRNTMQAESTRNAEGESRGERDQALMAMETFAGRRKVVVKDKHTQPIHQPSSSSAV